MKVCPQMKALWKLHAIILIDPPELAVIGPLTLTLAGGSVKVVSVDDVVLADFAVSHGHLPAWVLTHGGDYQGEKEKSKHCRSWSRQGV